MSLFSAVAFDLENCWPLQDVHWIQPQPVLRDHHAVWIWMRTVKILHCIHSWKNRIQGCIHTGILPIGNHLRRKDSLTACVTTGLLICQAMEGRKFQFVSNILLRIKNNTSYNLIYLVTIMTIMIYAFLPYKNHKFHHVSPIISRPPWPALRAARSVPRTTGASSRGRHAPVLDLPGALGGEESHDERQ